MPSVSSADPISMNDVPLDKAARRAAGGVGRGGAIYVARSHVFVATRAAYGVPCGPPARPLPPRHNPGPAPDSDMQISRNNRWMAENVRPSGGRRLSPTVYIIYNKTSTIDIMLRSTDVIL
ncbi:hypothetical protein EVAR_79700_1 [Eumeta japonica]|uniref:Uncharacterized protein n=1 Tax=Eumeta variegata TaxID=151549 RepID=A0A4C1T9A4_EUMVA|nr:hypothetical protein EVAR_79700_1 [Eumeta japonica]